MPHVAHEILEPRQATLIADRVHRLHGAPCLDPCRPRGIGFSAATSRRLRRQVQVQPEFLFQVSVAPAETQRSAKTVTPLAKDAHAISY